MNAQTLLYRQVHPHWVSDGEPNSQAFMPTRKDQGMLSVYDGDQITPAASWHHYTAVLGYASAGVSAVSLSECQVQQLPVHPDPQSFPEHALIDFSGLSRSQRERKAAHLKAAAIARGWQFRP